MTTLDALLENASKNPLTVQMPHANFATTTVEHALELGIIVTHAGQDGFLVITICVSSLEPKLALMVNTSTVIPMLAKTATPTVLPVLENLTSAAPVLTTLN